MDAAMDASRFIPSASPARAVEAVADAPRTTAAAWGTGMFADPLLWLALLLAAWAGIVHFGLNIKVGG